MFEHECHAARVAERTAAFVEIHAHVGYRSVGVVGCGLDEECHAMRAISFVNDLLVIGCVLLGGTLDCALDILLRHILRLGILNQNTQTGIARRVRTTGLDCYFNLLAQLGKCTRHVSPTFQLARLTVFKCSSHSYNRILSFSHFAAQN